MDYLRNTSLLINLKKDFARIVALYKNVQSVAVFTTLIYEMKDVLNDFKTIKYKRKQDKNTERRPSRASQRRPST